MLPGGLAVDITLPLPGRVGIDLGGELGGDMEPRARLTGPPDRAEAGLMKGLFVPVPSCVPGSDGSGVTAQMVAWGVVEVVGLVIPGRNVVVRRLPADVLRGTPNPKAAPRAAPVGEADFISAPPGPGAKDGSRVCRSGTDGREADGRRGQGGGREGAS